MSLAPKIDSIQTNAGQIGDVVQSILTEAQFQTIRGTNWVLMDGRDVTGSEYHAITGNTVLPDARGQFLRCKNNGRNDGQEDPAGERAVGHQQEDQIQGHRHDLGALVPNFNGGGAWAATSPVQSAQTATLDPISNGIHGTPRTGPETRVKNIAVNFFVRIN